MAEFQLVTDHIARLELSFRFAELFPTNVSIWLVRSREGFALIDAGPPETAGLMVDVISSTTDGRGPSVVLLTHGHYNHAGGLSALRLAWNPPIAAHPEEIPFIRGDREYARVRSKNPWYWIGSLLMNKTPWTIPNVQAVEPGQTIFGMKIIHVPGHTSGQVAYFHETDRAIICGDTVTNLRDRLSPPFSLTTIDRELAKRSILRLSERNFKHLLPSHGPPIMQEGRHLLFDMVRKPKKGSRR